MSNLSDENRALAIDFIERDPIPQAKVVERLRTHHADAPAGLLETMAFHLVTDLQPAFRDWMADMERFLRGEQPDPPSTTDARHLIYHLYNYLMIDSLLPTGSQTLLDLVQELRACAKSDDVDGIKNTIEALHDLIEGGSPIPEV